MKNITDNQAAYIAGLIDGEGTITICRQKPQKVTHAIPYIPFVAISNTNYKLMDYLVVITGIGTPRSRKDLRGNRKESWQWDVQREELRNFLNRISPYLIIKIEQAKILFEFLDTFKDYDRFNPVPLRDQALRDILCEEIQALNKRGT
jgi:hypothetical protein